MPYDGNKIKYLSEDKKTNLRNSWYNYCGEK